mgnify:CR=1 FL=1
MTSGYLLSGREGQQPLNMTARLTPELHERGRRDREAHPRQLRVRVIATLLELGEKKPAASSAPPTRRSRAAEGLGAAELDLSRTAGGCWRTGGCCGKARAPGDAVAADEELHVEEREASHSRWRAAGPVIEVSEKLGLHVERRKSPICRRLSKVRPPVEPALERAALLVDQRELAARVTGEGLSPVDGGEREGARRRHRVGHLDARSPASSGLNSRSGDRAPAPGRVAC